MTKTYTQADVDAAVAAVVEKAAVPPRLYAVYGRDRTDRYAKGFCAGAEAFMDQIRNLNPDVTDALDDLIKEAEQRGQIKAGSVFVNDGSAEERYCEDAEIACPCCGGSGHKDDAVNAMTKSPA